MVELLTTRQLARSLGASESSVKRWIDCGRIVATRTPGGHRRIALPDAQRFIQEERLLTGGRLIDDEAVSAIAASSGPSNELLEALIEADFHKTHQILVGSWLAGRPIWEIWDQLVCPAMRMIGQMWKEGPGGIAKEHRATDLVIQVMSQLRSMIETGAGVRRVAVGCAPELDPYLLPTMAVSTVLCESGWQSWNLGPMTPLGALLAMIRSQSPELVWISVSRELRVDEMDHLIEQVQMTRDCLVIVGGRGIPANWAAGGDRLFHGDSMTGLSTFLLERDLSFRTPQRPMSKRSGRGGHRQVRKGKRNESSGSIFIQGVALADQRQCIALELDCRERRETRMGLAGPFLCSSVSIPGWLAFRSRPRREGGSMRIAIVGAGVSGLVTAHLLHRSCELDVYEASSYAGGHTNTIPVRDEGRTIPVDTGFIVFNRPNYPNFCRLLESLEVDSQPTAMSFSVRCDRTGLEYNGSSLSTLFSQPTNLVSRRFWKILSGIARFNRVASTFLTSSKDEQTTVEEFIQHHRFSRDFFEHYLLPLGASLWSSPADQFRKFPIRFVAEFLNNHSMLQVDNRPEWRVIRGGSWKYVERLIEPFAHRLRLNCPVRRIVRSRAGVVLDHDQGSETYDEVVMATHADLSLRLVEDADATEREILSAFPYQVNTALLHTDTSVLPRKRRAWAAWNYRVPASEKRTVSVTYNMNILQSLEAGRVYCVSLNEQELIDERHILKRIRYAHPQFVTGRAAAQFRHSEMIRRNGISYCGAYWGYGFHEDGVRSALAVAAGFGKELAA